MERKKVLEYIKTRNSKENDPLENYILSDTREDIKHHENAEFTHILCNRTFFMRISNFKHGQGCPHCFGNHNKINYDYVKKVIESEDSYNLLSTEYINDRTPLQIYHTKCQNTSNITFRSWSSKKIRCLYCANNKKLDPVFIASNINLLDSEYYSDDLTSKNAHSKIKILHKTCGNSFYMQYNNFKHGQRCPICAIKNSSGNISKNAKKIIKILDNMNIKYELEKTFEDLKNIKKLRYDFYIQNKNLLIEYQGQQHFIYYKKGYFTKDKFDKIQQYDKIKYEYAKNNNINIEYISYKDDINSKLIEILNKY